MLPWFSTSVPSGKTYGEFPSNVSVRLNPSLIAAATANALNVDPGIPPATAQLIWLFR